MDVTVIHWKLREVMEQRRLKATDLASTLGISNNAIANLRKNEMPRMTEERLNQLMLGLNKLLSPGEPPIKLSDVVQFSLSPEELELIRNDCFQIPKIKTYGKLPDRKSKAKE